MVDFSIGFSAVSIRWAVRASLCVVVVPLASCAGLKTADRLGNAVRFITEYQCDKTPAQRELGKAAIAAALAGTGRKVVLYCFEQTPPDSDKPLVEPRGEGAASLDNPAGTLPPILLAGEGGA